MNIYDTANNLAHEIKTSDEYKNYYEIKKKIANDPDKNVKLKEFEQLRYNIQLEAMKGNNADEANNKKLQDKYAELIKDEEMKQYFDAEVKFNIMISDVNKIIGEAVQDIL